MSSQCTFKRALAAIHEATLDDACWPVAATLIDEACGTSGSELFVTEGPTDAPRILFVGVYRRGQHREDLERAYVADYYRTDEAVPRLAAGCRTAAERCALARPPTGLVSSGC